MKSVEEQLSNYKSVHLNKNNIKSHFIGIPLIVWAAIVLLSLHTFTVEFLEKSLHYTPANILLIVSLLYYFILHFKLALGMLLYVALNLYIASLVVPMENALWIAISVFIIGWVIQFIGHIYEKAKPAFFEDIMGLIIGPFFLMAETYFALGLEKQLHDDITSLAKDKRYSIDQK